MSGTRQLTFGWRLLVMLTMAPKKSRGDQHQEPISAACTAAEEEKGKQMFSLVNASANSVELTPVQPGLRVRTALRAGADVPLAEVIAALQDWWKNQLASASTSTGASASSASPAGPTAA